MGVVWRIEEGNNDDDREERGSRVNVDLDYSGRRFDLWLRSHLELLRASELRMQQSRWNRVAWAAHKTVNRCRGRGVCVVKMERLTPGAM